MGDVWRPGEGFSGLPGRFSGLPGRFSSHERRFSGLERRHLRSEWRSIGREWRLSQRKKRRTRALDRPPGAVERFSRDERRLSPPEKPSPASQRRLGAPPTRHPTPRAHFARPVTRPTKLESVRSVLSVAVTLALLYAGLIVFALVSYKKVLYPAPVEPPLEIPARATLVSRPTPGGVPFHGIYFAGKPGMPTLLLFHGNGETIAWSLPMGNDLSARGFGVLLAEYRGYGLSQSSGTPSEEGLYDDASAALGFLSDQGVTREHIVAWGTSLGTGVASEIAAQGKVSRLILCSPFTSIREVAAQHAWFLPTKWIMSEQLDTLSKAGRITVPTLVVHGDQDEVVPFVMGQDVAAAIKGAELIRVPGGHHNDLYSLDPTLFPRIVAFASGGDAPSAHRPAHATP